MTEQEGIAEPSPEAAGLPVEEAHCFFCGGGPAARLASGRDYEYATSPDVFEILRCDACQLAFIQPRPAAGAMATIYPLDYYAYNEDENELPFLKFFRDRIERMKVRAYERLAGKADASLLDIGCGDGRLLEIIQRFGPAGWQLAGIEIGEKAAEKAAAKGFEVRPGDFEDLRVDDWADRFDLALMHHVIEHVRDPRAAVRKAARMLRTGGILSVETPEIRGWDFSLFHKRYWGGYHFPRHFYLFDADTLARLLREEGFEIVTSRSILSPAFWVFSFHNWLIDRRWGRPLARLFHPQNPLAIMAATAIDLVQLILTRQTTNLQVHARKLEAPH